MSIVDCRLSIVDCRLSIADWRLAKDKTHQVCFTGIAPELQSQSRVDAGRKTKMGLFLIRRVSIEGWINVALGFKKWRQLRAFPRADDKRGLGRQGFQHFMESTDERRI